MLFVDHKLVPCPRVWSIKAKFAKAADKEPPLTPPPLAQVAAPYSGLCHLLPAGYDPI